MYGVISLQRRLSQRVRVELFLNEVVGDRLVRALARNLSPTGLLVQKLVEPNLPLVKTLGLEFELPGTGEVIWAAAEPRFDAVDDDFLMTGLAFTAMAHKHERLLRDFIRARIDLTRRRARNPSPGMNPTPSPLLDHRPLPS